MLKIKHLLAEGKIIYDEQKETNGFEYAYCHLNEGIIFQKDKNKDIYKSSKEEKRREKLIHCLVRHYFGFTIEFSNLSFGIQMI